MIVRRMTWLALAFTAAVFGCDRVEQRDAPAPAAAVPAAAAEAPKPAAPAPAAAPVAAPAAALTRVDPSLVCMVNNQFMGRPQIPIEADGRTYYGCCEMCKGRLANDPSSRVATDPVSRRPVDKAVAVIGMTGDGRTLYFESEETFAAYPGGARGAE